LAAPFVLTVRVYWEDTDGGGIVYYANYLKFLERARSEWLRSIGVDQAALFREQGVQFVVVEANLRYHQPARYDDALAVTAAIDSAKGASLNFAQSIYRGATDGELLLSADIRVASLDAVTLRPRRLPRELTQALTA
jgi:acyl-CoA thioester hydrolase